jgi:hypothetical protein
MPLTQVSLNNTLSFTLSGTTNGFPVSAGPDNIASNLQGINTTTWNQLFAQTYSITASGTQAFDLTSFTNLISESVTLMHALVLVIQVTGTNAVVTLGPSASNGLVWFFGGTSPTIAVPNGGFFAYSLGAASTGQVIDSTHKSMTLTNTGSGTATVVISILGSTT